jgi:DegV family protein with EDD domain
VAPVKIVTDSSAFLPRPELIAELGIEVLPLTVHIGGQSYLERINTTDEVFMRKMVQNSKNVEVDAPTVGQVRRFFERVSQGADRIVCIHVSSALNDVAEIVREAAQSFAGRQRIVVLDTATTSIGLGLIVEAAARAAADDAPLPEIVRIVRGMVPHMYALLFSDSLEYLEAWGRLGSAQTLLGTMLGLKPLSTMEDGDLLPIEKVRNYQRAIDKLYDFIIEFSHIEQMYLLQHDFEIEAAQLLERLELAFPGREFPVIGYSPSLAVHIGPKALGVVVYEGDR